MVSLYSCTLAGSGHCYRLLNVVLLCWLVSGCSAPAPVEERNSSAAGADARAPENPVYRQHIVVKGETLYAVARRYSVTPSQLQQLNGLLDINQLEIGQRLRVPSARIDYRPLAWPLQRYKVSSEFGARRGRHQGMDLVAPKKTPIRASAAGVVSFTGKKNGYGNVVILRHGRGLETLYAHNDKNKVKTGQRVKQGQVIATVGHSGRATGSHLHFEAIVQGRKSNPRQYLAN